MEKQNRQQLACDFIHNNYVAFQRLRFDEIAQKVQVRTEDDTWRYITNADINTMVCDCCTETGTGISSREILTVLNAGNSYIPRVHPLREYVHNLRPYTPDQPDWIDMVAQQVHIVDACATDRREAPVDRPCGAVDGRSATPVVFHSELQCSASETNYNEAERSDLQGFARSTASDLLWRRCFKKWFVAMVASWMKDEIVNHQVLVLIGKQGIYKTTWLERLIPPQLRDYCCKLANSTQLTKDDRLRIAEFGLINMDELDAMTPRELNAIKSIITASDVNERAAYGYTKERRMRLASFCASSNRREFLTDITGNRRWLPFEVESIQNPFFTTLPYEYMYAQAWALANDPSFSYWFELDEIAIIEQHNEDFRAQDSEEQLLPILFDIPAEGKGEFMTTAQISERLVTYGNIKKPMVLSRLGMLLGQTGYKAVRPRVGGAKTRGWVVYQRDTEEINAMKRLLRE